MERRCDEMHQHALMCRTVVFVFCLAVLFMMMTMMMLCLISSNDLRLYSLDVCSVHTPRSIHTTAECIHNLILKTISKRLEIETKICIMKCSL